jgi:RNA polymerase sigma-70 factor (ECF subfamily)
VTELTTDEREWLAERFEAQRGRLRAVAYRMLGSASEADDAVQETWLRLSRSDASTVANLDSWLTTVLSRVCLNVLQQRRTHSEVALSPGVPDRAEPRADGADPEHEALLAESIGLALLVVLETLQPAERVAFVLHDMFGVPFEEIAMIVDRSTPAARQLASRARRRVRRRDAPAASSRLRQAELVDAFLAAARGGDFDALLSVLDPDVVLRADKTAVKLGAPGRARGATDVARFSRRAHGADRALVGGEAAAVWVQDGRPRVVFNFTTRADKIVVIELIADADRLRALDLVIADDAHEV